MRKNNIIVLAILALSALLRFGSLNNLMIFTPDEAYQAYITQTLIKDFHIIWIGLSAGAYNLYLGPLWQYIIYPFLYFSKGDPIALGIAASMLGVAATYLIYLVGKLFFTTKTGLVASLIYAASPLMIYYDQKPYPSGITFLALLIAYSLHKTDKSAKWWIVFAASFAFIFHTHLSLLPVLFVAIYIAIKNRKKITFKILGASFAVFIVLISQLIAFDYFHKGSNISAPLTVLKTNKASLVKLDLSYHTQAFFDSLGRLIYLNPNSTNSDELLFSCTLVSTNTRTKPHPLISLSVLFVLIYFLLKKDTWKDSSKKLLAVLTLSIALPFIIFQFINPIEYYLLGFFPFVILIIASVLESLKPKLKLLAYFLLILMVLFGIFTITTAKSDYGLAAKRTLVTKVITSLQGDSYNLAEEGDCHKYEAARYVFSVYGKIPNQSSDDPVFGWLYKNEMTDVPGKYTVLIKETRSSKSVPSNFIHSLQEGGFSAFMYEN